MEGHSPVGALDIFYVFKSNDLNYCVSSAPTPAQLPAPEPPRRSATGGGVVVDLFRDDAKDVNPAANSSCVRPPGAALSGGDRSGGPERCYVYP